MNSSISTTSSSTAMHIWTSLRVRTLASIAGRHCYRRRPPTGGLRRRRAALVVLLAVTVMSMSFVVTISWLTQAFFVESRPPVYAVFGTDDHQSVLRLPDNRVRVGRLPPPPLDRPSTEVDPPGVVDDLTTTDTVAVFVVLDDVDAAGSVGWDWETTPNGSSSSKVNSFASSLFDCFQSYRYHIYVVAPVATLSDDAIVPVDRELAALSDESDGPTVQIPPGRRKLEEAAERLRRRCRRGSPVGVDAWTVRVAARRRPRGLFGRLFGSGSSGNVDDQLDDDDVLQVPPRYVADLVTEAYVDNVTWYDVVVVASDRRPAAADDEPSGAASSPSPSMSVVFRQLLNRTHMEIFGDAWPRKLRSFAEVSVYLTYLRSSALVADGRLPKSLRQLISNRRRFLNWYTDASAVAAGGCLRCRLRRPPSPADEYRVISMSLYGDDPRYTIGAVRNAQLLPLVFPGWRLRFYVRRPPAASTLQSLLLDPTRTYRDPSDRGPPTVLRQVLDRLRELGAEVVEVDTEKTRLSSPMVWRFLVADDESVDVFISRDADSRLSPRDAAAVADWLQRGDDRSSASTAAAAFHCVRDHPSHADFAANGGMWGARRRQLAALLGGRTFASMLVGYGSEYLDDMRFIDAEVWSRLVGSPTPAPPGEAVPASSVVLCHDSVSCDRWPGAVPFDVPRRDAEHVGQVFDAWSRPRQGDIDIIRERGLYAACEPERPD